MIETTTMTWITLAVIVGLMYFVDLVLFGSRSGDRVSFASSMTWTAFWFAIGIGFTGYVYWTAGGGDFGRESAGLYLTSFVVEKSLSMDNVFVFIVILTHFAVPQKLRRWVLFWGIIGALVLRFVFIFAGLEVIERFDWLLIVLGLVLVFTAAKLAITNDDDIDPDRNIVLRIMRKFVPTTHLYDGKRFTTKIYDKRVATPMLAVFIVVMTTDLLFAIDSIPAVFAITTDPFIVVTANAMSLLGLRALYFVLEDLMHRFEYLKYGLAVILAFVGIKMIGESIWPDIHLPVAASLGFIVFALGASIVISWIATSGKEPHSSHGVVMDDERGGADPDDAGNDADADADEDRTER